MEIMKGGENLVTMENNTHIIKPLVDSFSYALLILRQL